MSIIMKASGSPTTRQAERPGRIDSHVRELLDHIAIELAAEYVRLMEAAAAAEAPPSPTLQAKD
jgi:hypothetical protein